MELKLRDSQTSLVQEANRPMTDKNERVLELPRFPETFQGLS
jgi:hypothetical protein